MCVAFRCLHWKLAWRRQSREDASFGRPDESTATFVTVDLTMAEKASSLRQQPVPAGSGVLRFVSAASLFDGHDAAINMIRRLLQASGAEVVHLGHNRSVSDIVRAAIQEDADGIAVSSYQGGHNEYFAYMVDMLRDLKAEHIRVVVGGGGRMSPEGLAAREAYGVARI